MGEPSTTPSDSAGGDPVATPVTELSPNALPSLTTVSNQPRASTPGEFPLDPGSLRVQDAVDDLAARLGVQSFDVTVIEARAVSWGDSSLGCPQPGMDYLQRLTDGSLVILNVNGVDYRYTGGDPLRLCENVVGG